MSAKSSSSGQSSVQNAVHTQLFSIYGKLSNQPSSYEKKANYKFDNVLGAGTYGIVKRALMLSTKEEVAVKIILKKNIKGHESMVYEELDLLQRLNHPHIVGFRDWFESKDKFYLVTQLATGGELFDRICERGKYTEQDAVETIKEVLEAVDYLHNLNIVHRDLKPENLLYLTPDPKSALVLADFGIAKMLDSNEVLTTMAGSFGYAAPEILLRTGHGKPCDIWSLGVITYTLLCGYTPFRSESVPEFLVEVRENGVIFHSKYWKGISEEAKEFILLMLETDPSKRATTSELLKHKWLSGSTATEKDLLPNIREGFNAKSKFIQAIEAVKLANKIRALGFDDDDDDYESVFQDTSEGNLSSNSVSDVSSRESSGLLEVPSASSSVRRTSFGSRGNATKVFQEVVKAVSRINSANKDEGDEES
ncbi:kinase-like domain-containing protein [Dipodascopsis uninucleata]